MDLPSVEQIAAGRSKGLSDADLFARIEAVNPGFTAGAQKYGLTPEQAVVKASSFQGAMPTAQPAPPAQGPGLLSRMGGAALGVVPGAQSIMAARDPNADAYAKMGAASGDLLNGALAVGSGGVVPALKAMGAAAPAAAVMGAIQPQVQHAADTAGGWVAGKLGQLYPNAPAFGATVGTGVDAAIQAVPSVLSSLAGHAWAQGNYTNDAVNQAANTPPPEVWALAQQAQAKGIPFTQAALNGSAAEARAMTDPNMASTAAKFNGRQAAALQNEAANVGMGGKAPMDQATAGDALNAAVQGKYAAASQEFKNFEDTQLKPQTATVPGVMPETVKPGSIAYWRITKFLTDSNAGHADPTTAPTVSAPSAAALQDLADSVRSYKTPQDLIQARRNLVQDYGLRFAGDQTGALAGFKNQAYGLLNDSIYDSLGGTQSTLANDWRAANAKMTNVLSALETLKADPQSGALANAPFAADKAIRNVDTIKAFQDAGGGDALKEAVMSKALLGAVDTKTGTYIHDRFASAWNAIPQASREAIFGAQQAKGVDDFVKLGNFVEAPQSVEVPKSAVPGWAGRVLNASNAGKGAVFGGLLGAGIAYHTGSGLGPYAGELGGGGALGYGVGKILDAHAADRLYNTPVNTQPPAPVPYPVYDPQAALAPFAAGAYQGQRLRDAMRRGMSVR